MAKRRPGIASGVEIGHVRLRVAELDRASRFYEGVLGFAVDRISDTRAWVGADGRRQIELTTAAGDAEPHRAPVVEALALRYPARAALAGALARLASAGIAIEGATDWGTGEALSLRDPDDHLIELYYERPREAWPAAGQTPVPLDLDALRSETLNASGDEAAVEGDEAASERLSESMRGRLQEMRSRLLGLHKVLLDDARSSYELDRGSVGSNASLLQLVIHDPWFAWLRPLSELVVRIDEALQPDSAAGEPDGAALLEDVAHLISPDRAPDGFSERYYEALHRQPAVIVAHAEVRRILKQPK
jgi:catechol 2,3-dioxygenase